MVLSLAFYAAYDPVTPGALTEGVATGLLRDELGFRASRSPTTSTRGRSARATRSGRPRSPRSAPAPTWSRSPRPGSGQGPDGAPGGRERRHAEPRAAARGGRPRDRDEAALGLLKAARRRIDERERLGGCLARDARLRICDRDHTQMYRADISCRDMESLSPTGRVILGMLGLWPMSGYEIKSLVDHSTRFFWAASYGQIYPELRKLAEAGLIEGEEQAQGDRKRTVHTLTPAGREALERLARRAAGDPRDSRREHAQALLRRRRRAAAPSSQPRGEARPPPRGRRARCARSRTAARRRRASRASARCGSGSSSNEFAARVVRARARRDPTRREAGRLMLERLADLAQSHRRARRDRRRDRASRSPASSAPASPTSSTPTAPTIPRPRPRSPTSASRRPGTARRGRRPDRGRRPRARDGRRAGRGGDAQGRGGPRRRRRSPASPTTGSKAFVSPRRRRHLPRGRR